MFSKVREKRYKKNTTEETAKRVSKAKEKTVRRNQKENINANNKVVTNDYEAFTRNNIRQKVLSGAVKDEEVLHVCGRKLEPIIRRLQ